MSAIHISSEPRTPNDNESIPRATKSMHLRTISTPDANMFSTHTMLLGTSGIGRSMVAPFAMFHTAMKKAGMRFPSIPLSVAINLLTSTDDHQEVKAAAELAPHSRVAAISGEIPTEGPLADALAEYGNGHGDALLLSFMMAAVIPEPSFFDRLAAMASALECERSISGSLQGEPMASRKKARI